MQRVVSVWFPHWPTDRLRRSRISAAARSPEPAAPPGPLVTALHDGRRRVIAAADPAAQAQGLRPGMAMAQALALVPGLEVAEAAPAEDAAALHRLARWCQRTTPLVAVDPPDGLWLDITGAAHLFGDEASLLRRLQGRLSRDGLAARAAVADTPGAAYALARYGAPLCVAAPARQMDHAATLPIAALRLPPEMEATLRRLGFEQIGHLVRIPRALLTRRFGILPGLRLDQVQGRVHEPLTPLAPEQVLQRRTGFLEPLLTAEAFKLAIAHLAGPLCAEMERAGQGARQLDLLFERVDNQVLALRVGTSRPSRDARHLARMLEEKLDLLDPGLGIEAMRLVVSLAEPLQWEQQDDGRPSDATRLVDRLVNRLGPQRVYRIEPVESAYPERAVQRRPTDGTLPAPPPTKHDEIPSDEPATSSEPHPGQPQPGQPQPGQPQPLRLHPGRYPALLEQADAPPGIPGRKRSSPPSLRLIQPVDCPASTAEPPSLPWKASWKSQAKGAKTPKRSTVWPDRLQAPARLLDPPRPVEALAALPDQPPFAFTWRRHRHRIRRADGPERIHGEWWRHDEETASVRDYFQVEDETGRRFWLFRNGNGQDPATGDLSWYLHGLF